MVKKILFIILCLSIKIEAQEISMNFPRFAGKNYIFIIFSGSNQTTVYKGIVPEDGIFTLNIPTEKAPYIGMSRWLITDTREGGGLDMYIPGRDFSVSCTEAKPNESNIIYSNNNGNYELNKLYKIQDKIFQRYEAMHEIIRIYDKKNENYPVFMREIQKLRNSYDIIQNEMKFKSSYISTFIQIVNITRGKGTKLYDNEEDTAKNINRYINTDLDLDRLYTSGHWTNVLYSWVDIHTRVINDIKVFASDFEILSKRIISSRIYSDFAERVAYYLNQQKKEDYIKIIAPMVKKSGKIENYTGSLVFYLK